MNLVEKIKTLAKENIVYLYFDMDGTCAEYKSGEKDLIKGNAKDFFLIKRPLFSILKIMEDLANSENVIVGILSNCYFEEQKQDKITWLQKYAPFIKRENINIIVLSNETYTTETKDYLKPNLLKKLHNDTTYVYLIEDNHQILKATRKSGLNGEHISTLIS